MTPLKAGQKLSLKIFHNGMKAMGGLFFEFGPYYSKPENVKKYLKCQCNVLV